MLAMDALLYYRNTTFHNWLEWKDETRKQFNEKIVNAQWPVEWFSYSQSNGQPWIYYMSKTFQCRCVNLIDEIEKGVGGYINDKFE